MNKKNIAIITAATLALGLGAWGVTSANASPVVKQAASVSAPTFTANDAPEAGDTADSSAVDAPEAGDTADSSAVDAPEAGDTADSSAVDAPEAGDTADSSAVDAPEAGDTADVATK